MSIKRSFLIIVFSFLYFAIAFPQFRIRLLSDESDNLVIFKVIEGTYKIKSGSGKITDVNSGESVILTRMGNRLSVKTRNENGFTCDSVELIMVGSECQFSLRTESENSLKRIYNGNLICKSDLGSVFLINTPDTEDYIAGVVMAEGGNGGSVEYYKTQAVLVRTYLNKYEKKHINDFFNLCDGVHCQAYHGITTDSLIVNAVLKTKGEVITDQDSVLIISAFHSNCGGETVAAADVWLIDQPYLKKVIDPYCLSSRNATWETRISTADWTAYLQKKSFMENITAPSVFNFTQKNRKVNYAVATFNYPLTVIRADFGLKSTFFSVTSAGDYVILKGKGYGHGIGLCQEGAMVMAKKGLDYKQIINFYYSCVKLIDVKHVKFADDI